MVYEVSCADGFVVSDDPGRLDIDFVVAFLAEQSYWAKGRPRATTERAIRYSLCFGLFDSAGAQAGFARVLSDRALRAHLADVFVVPALRGRGFGKALVGAVLDHPDLRDVGTWSLSTQDAHGLYASFGFGPILEPDRQMMRVRPPRTSDVG